MKGRKRRFRTIEGLSLQAAFFRFLFREAFTLKIKASNGNLSLVPLCLCL